MQEKADHPAGPDDVKILQSWYENLCQVKVLNLDTHQEDEVASQSCCSVLQPVTPSPQCVTRRYCLDEGVEVILEYYLLISYLEHETGEENRCRGRNLSNLHVTSLQDEFKTCIELLSFEAQALIASAIRNWRRGNDRSRT
eukprot:752722-Hanusia_phi.AAC.1